LTRVKESYNDRFFLYLSHSANCSQKNLLALWVGGLSEHGADLLVHLQEGRGDDIQYVFQLHQSGGVLVLKQIALEDRVLDTENAVDNIEVLRLQALNKLR
jgi:hypothetical protein